MNPDLTMRLTTVYRKGEPVTTHQAGPVEVVEIWGYPHVEEAREVEKIDMHFVTVGIRQPETSWDDVRVQFAAEVAEYPEPDRLAGGPSYIELGGVFGDQELALRWMALGKSLGFWGIITPGSFGITGPDADSLAGGGMVMIAPKEIPA